MDTLNAFVGSPAPAGFFPKFFLSGPLAAPFSRSVENICPVGQPGGCGGRDPRTFFRSFCRFSILLGGLLATLGVIGADFTEVSRRGSLRWANDAEGGAPYIYHPADRPGDLTGFEVDFAAALCARLGVKSEFIQFGWVNLIPGLQQGGNFDVIIAGLERSPENQEKVSLSRPYFAFSQQLVTRADNQRIQKLADLKGLSVGVLTGTASHRLASAQPGVVVKIYDDNVNYFRDLELGRLDAVLTDSPIAQVNLAGNAKLHAAGPPTDPGFYAVGVRPSDTNLLARINQAIADLTADGTLQRIYTPYGLWTPEQALLATWQPEPVGTETPLKVRRSALRDWRIYIPILLRAAVTTLWVTCAGMTLAVAWGAVLALVRQYGPRPFRWAAITYIEIFRGTPLLLQLYFIYFGLAQQFGWNLSAGLAAILALGLNYAATEAENYRAGLEAVPRGQTEAALALGMSRALAIRRVILPQAVRISLPSVTNDFIAMFKDSSIVSVIGLVELTKEYQIRGLDTGDYIGIGLMTAAIYLVISYAASLGLGVLERKLR